MEKPILLIKTMLNWLLNTHNKSFINTKLLSQMSKNSIKKLEIKTKMLNILLFKEATPQIMDPIK